MKKIFTLIITLLFANLINAQIVNIPDANFKAYLVENPNINTNGDSEIQVSEAAAYTDDMSISNLGISDMTGIEAFINLQYLYCDNNSIGILDLSSNTALIQAYCNDNLLTSLIVTGCVNLTTLHCQNNQLTSLDLSTNVNLSHLYCQNNQLAALDFTNNTSLNTILCQGNQLTHLDASMTAWTVLDCSDNNLIYLKVSNGNNGMYEFFNATLNDLVCVTVDSPAYSYTHWVSDVDDLVEFSTNCLACTVSITDPNFFNYLINNPLININGDGNIQCSEAHAFTGTINAPGLNIADLGGIEEFWHLTVLNIYGNQLTNINISNGVDLISNNVDLLELYCSLNQLTSLDVTNNTKLTTLLCNSNSINTTIDLSQNGHLVEFNCKYNQIPSLDLTFNTNLSIVDCRSNQIGILDVSQNTALTKLNCADNDITSLDVSLSPNLYFLNCMNNQLSSLNVKNGNNVNFTTFFATGNTNLTCIEVDDPVWSTANWTNIDPIANFNTNCFTYVPDDNFEQALINLGYDSGALDDYVPTANIASVTNLLLNNKNIADLTGIDGFASLQKLSCNLNQLTDLDLSQNLNLNTLSAINNQISNLNISQNVLLQDVVLSTNDLGVIDVSQNVALTSLNVKNNHIATVDVSSNVALNRLDVRNNQLLTELNVKNGNNTNFSNNHFKATGNPNLTCIEVDNAAWSTANWTNIDATASFGTNCISGVPMTYVPDDNFEQALINLGYDSGVLDDYVPTANINSITTLDVSNNNIADLTGIEDFAALTSLNCDNNQLTVLDVTNLTALQYLFCSHNAITNTIDTSQNSGLKRLFCGYNQLTNLDLSQNANLKRLSCYVNQLTALDMSLNTALVALKCQSNALTELNIKNGNNTNMLNANFIASNNVNLTCIEVDNVAYSTANWTNIDATANYSEHCVGGVPMTYVPDDNFETYLETHDANGNLFNMGFPTAMGNGVMDDYVPTAKISSVTSLSVSNKNIADLTGIQDFVALTQLYCFSNQLTSLDVTNNTALTKLYCFSNQLTSLDVTNNTALTKLYCFSNQLTSLDVSNNTALTDLRCFSNQLTSLDVTNNTALTKLYCYSNQLTSLDVTNNTALTDLRCSSNQLTSLDVTNNTALTDLRCSSNQLTSLDVSNNTALTSLHCFYNQLTSLDVTTNTALTLLYCSFNQLTSLDVSNNTTLTYLLCFSNQLTSLDVSNNTALTSLQCFSNQLTDLDVSNNTALTYLQCNFNQLTSLNVKNGNNTNMPNTDFNAISNPNLTCIEVDDAVWSTANWIKIDATANFSEHCVGGTPMTYVPDDNFEQALIDLGYDSGVLDDYVPTANISGLTTLNVFNKNIADLTGIQDFTALTDLTCSSNQLTSLDVSNNTALTQLYCRSNQLTSLDVTNNTALTILYCYSNQLTSLDVSNNTALTKLYCYYNQLTSLDVSNNIDLIELYCYYNQLTSLDVSSNTALTKLFCASNPLTSLNVVNNTVLTDLRCNSNQLTSLDVTNNTALTKLRCSSNQLTSLDVTNNTALTKLVCYTNQLTSLNVVNNTVLTHLRCNSNQLTSLDVSNNTALINLWCYSNQLTSLNVKNGNNTNITNIHFKATNNPNLTCIEVDDAAWSTTNWINIDATASFSEHCSYCTGTTTEFTTVGWSNGVPTPTSKVLISDTYQVAQEGDIDACSCEVTASGYLQIEANSFVKLDQNLKNNGVVEIMHQGSFVQTDDAAIITGSGSFTTHLQTTQLDDPSRFTYFSSPVQNQDLTVFSSWARMDRLWRFNESTQNWTLANQNDIMLPAVGYVIQGDVDTGQYPFIGYADFNGAFNNGIYSYPLTYNAGGTDDDNALVGNPYPSAIDATLLLSSNLSANAFYFWTHKSGILANGSDYASNDYAIWNSSGGIASASNSPAPTGYIASGQGFFVDATATGNLVFNNAMRVTNNNTDFRRPATINRDRIWLNLSNENGNFNQILINFTENGTLNFDNKLDAIRIDAGNDISFYSNGVNEENFAIQAVPNLATDDNIPLGYRINTDTVTNLNISIDHTDFQNDTNVYLKDNLLNIIHDLKQSDYQFSVEQGVFNDRFELIFNRNALNTKDYLLNTDKLIVSNYSENTINVSTFKGNIIKTLNAYDVLGKLIINIKPNQNNFTINTNINEGTILFIKVKLENGQILNTKFIKF